MTDQKIINVAYPRKRNLPKINPLYIGIVIILVIGISWILFFRLQEKQELAPERSEKQKEATPSAQPRESTPSAKQIEKKVGTSDWYEYKDVKETFSILVPKGWFFDKTLKGPRDRGKILGGVANFNIAEEEFDQKENFAVYFELDSKDPGISLKNHATKAACLRTTDIIPTEESCQNPSTPASQKEIKVGDKEAVWQEIHGLVGIGIEVYILKSETEVLVLYSAGMVDKTDGEFRVKQEFLDIGETMLSTFKFL